MALIGLGIMAAFSVELVRFGWRIGKSLIEFISDCYERMRE